MKLPYFKLGDAISDIKSDFKFGTLMDKTGSIAKFAGKTVANVGMLTVEAGVHIVKNIPEYMGQQAEKTLKENPNLTEEQRGKLENMVKKAREFKK